MLQLALVLGVMLGLGLVFWLELVFRFKVSVRVYCSG